MDWLIPELGWRGCNLVSTLLIQAKEPKRLGEYLVDCAAEGRASVLHPHSTHMRQQTLPASPAHGPEAAGPTGRGANAFVPQPR